MHGVDRSSLRILIVDDHRDTTLAMVRLLRSDGFQAVGVSGYDAALTAVRSEPFDLLLCDIAMPGRDGYALLEALRDVRPIRAFALTGYGGQGDALKVMEGGFDRFFLKPFNVDELMAAVEGVARELQAERQGPAGSISADGAPCHPGDSRAG